MNPLFWYGPYAGSVFWQRSFTYVETDIDYARRIARFHVCSFTYGSMIMVKRNETITRITSDTIRVGTMAWIAIRSTSETLLNEVSEALTLQGLNFQDKRSTNNLHVHCVASAKNASETLMMVHMKENHDRVKGIAERFQGFKVTRKTSLDTDNRECLAEWWPKLSKKARRAIETGKPETESANIVHPEVVINGTTYATYADFMREAAVAQLKATPTSTPTPTPTENDDRLGRMENAMVVMADAIAKLAK